MDNFEGARIQFRLENKISLDRLVNIINILKHILSSNWSQMNQI